MEKLSSFAPESADLEANPSLNVVIAYEDFQTGKNAKKTYDYLVEHVGEDCVFDNQMWKFDVLALPKLREIAVQDALNADIVIISSRGGELPAGVKTWLAGWTTQPDRPMALVALFDCDLEHSRVTNAYLSAIARQAGVEFFAQPGAFASAAAAEQLVDDRRFSKAGQRTLSNLAGVLRRDPVVPRSSWDQIQSR